MEKRAAAWCMVCPALSICHDNWARGCILMCLWKDSSWWNMSLSEADLFLPLIISSPFTASHLLSRAAMYLIWVKQTDRPCYGDTHAHTQSQMSLFIFITNSCGIPYYNRPILFGVTVRSGTWKAGIGHSQCGRKQIRDQHHSVSGDAKRLDGCAATVRVVHAIEPRNWRREKWDKIRFSNQTFFF